MRHGRTTGRLVRLRSKAASLRWNKPRPKGENPFGIPGEVMRRLASENLSTVDEYNRRLKELLQEKFNA